MAMSMVKVCYEYKLIVYDKQKYKRPIHHDTFQSSNSQACHVITCYSPTNSSGHYIAPNTLHATSCTLQTYEGWQSNSFRREVSETAQTVPMRPTVLMV